MTYHFSEVVETCFDEAIAQVAESLKQEGMGVLTEMDVAHRTQSER
jgi:uncharacterized protein (DUF302 family)